MTANDQTFRLFVAIETPGEVKEALRRVQNELCASLPGDCVRWTRPGQLHLTLRFLGDVRSADVEALTAAVRKVCETFPSIQLRAEGLGFFPPKKLPRVIWAGIGGDVEKLSALAKAVQTATASFTSEPPGKDFNPHLTLGRCKFIARDQAKTLTQFAENAGGAPFGAWTATGVVIFRSEASAAGHRHEELARLPFAGNVQRS